MNDTTDGLRKAFEADVQQYFVQSLTPDRGYDTPIDNLKAFFADQSARIAELERRVEELAEENEAFSKRAVDLTNHMLATDRDLLERIVARHNNSTEIAKAFVSQLRAEVERLTKENEQEQLRTKLAAELHHIAKLNLETTEQECERLTKERDEARRQRDAQLGFHQKWRIEADDLRAQLAEREEDRARLDHLENLIQHLPHTRFYWTDDPDEEMPVGFSITIEGCETSQVVGATLRECIDNEMAYDEAAAIRAARAQPEEKA